MKFIIKCKAKDLKKELLINELRNTKMNDIQKINKLLGGIEKC